MKKLSMHWQIFFALVLAVLVGFFGGEKVVAFEYFGTVFIAALKMMVMPVVSLSILTGVSNIKKTENLGKLGMKTLFYYVGTSFLAILTGLYLVNRMQPGVGAQLGLQAQPEGWTEALRQRASGSAWETMLDMTIRIVPDNPAQAFVQGEMMQVIVFCLLFGYFSTRVVEPYRTLLRDLFQAGFRVTMRLMRAIMTLAPIGIFGLVVKIVAVSGVETFHSLGRYVATVSLGLGVHACITLPLVLKFIARVSPLEHFQAMSTALITAFSSSSSSAALPITLESIRREVGVSSGVSGFVLPLGSTMNMDGTALYECVAVMFIAQAYGISLDITQQCVLVFTALLASIGAAGIPMAGVVMMAVVLKAVGLPLEGVGLILAVDRILDMCRTTVNVWSDTCGAVVIARSEGETLKI
ncbi:MAG: dicarboxylate/amino acid:cation symporter [Myxococcota bacterium]